MKAAARLVLLAGAAGVALLLSRAAPRDVVLVYGLGDRRLASLEVEIVRGAEVIRRAELRPGTEPAGSLRHPVKLPDGDYLVRLRLAPRDGPALRTDRTITITESTTIVIPLEQAAR